MDITMGLSHYCYIKPGINNNVVCIGQYYSSYYHLNPTINQNVTVKQIAAGFLHTCLLSDRGGRTGIYCWGLNNYNQIKTPDYLSLKRHNINKPNYRIINIYAGYYDSCAVYEFYIQYSDYNLFIYNKKVILKYDLICWGLNKDIYNNYPRVLQYDYVFHKSNGVRRHGSKYLDKFKVAIGNSIICAIKYSLSENKPGVFDYYLFTCWGGCLNSPALFNMCLIPEQYKHTTESVSIGNTHMCSIIMQNYTSTPYTNNNHQSFGCWGNNYFGQLDIPEHFTYHAVVVTAGNQITCALKANYLFKCWGDTVSTIYKRDPNNRMIINKEVVNKVVVPDNIVKRANKISAGDRHSCVISGGILSCTGNNEYSQLDIPQSHKYDSVDIQTGWDYSCSVNLNNNVDCYGLNILGQTDVDALLKYNSNQLGHGLSILGLKSGLNHSCAIHSSKQEILQDANYIPRTDSGTLVCWGGNNEYDQLNIPNEYKVNVRKASVGDEHTCAARMVLDFNVITVDKRDEVFCWGHNDVGQVEVNAKAKGDATQKVQEIDSGAAHSCTLTKHFFNTGYSLASKSDVLCWGSDRYGQCTQPQDGILGVLQMSAGTIHTCVIDVSYNLVCWGGNYREYKINSIDGPLNLFGFGLVSAGYDYNCALSRTGDAVCWGDNEYGKCIINGVGGNYEDRDDKMGVYEGYEGVEEEINKIE